MTGPLPPALVDALEAGACLPLVGWGHPDFVVQGPFVVETAARSTGGGRRDARIERERQVMRWLRAAGPRLHVLYDALAALPVSAIVALNPDRALPHRLAQHDARWILLKRDQLACDPEARVLIPLVGSSDDAARMILTREDYIYLEQLQPSAWRLARARVALNPVLLLGCDPDDLELFRHLFCPLLADARSRTTGWIVCRSIAPRMQERWQSLLGIEAVVGDPARCLRAIVRASNRPLPRAHRAAGVDLGVSPYKNLDYFERDEAEVFFGRAVEVRRLVDLVCAHRLVILTGPSGSGKSSLLNAGLLAWTDGERRQLGVYARCEDDPVSAIAAAVAERMRAPMPAFDARRDRLVDFLARAGEITRRVPVIVLDQAEELFTRFGDAPRDRFFDALHDCYTSTKLVARFVIALREDYLVNLAPGRAAAPPLLHNVFYLPEMSRAEAIQAIRGPAERLGVAFDAALAERILDDIASDVVAPPQIQIVCSRLFEKRGARGTDAALYGELGGAGEILHQFLHEELRAFGNDEWDARSLLKAMVTAEGTKEVLSIPEIAHRARLPRARAEALLETLRNRSRLVRSIPQPREERFELAHEYLTTDIWKLMTLDERRRRAVEDLLMREVRSWQTFRHLRLGLDRLEALERTRDLLEPDELGLTVILLGAVKHRRPIEGWIERVRALGPEAQECVARELFAYFHDRDVQQRREAAEVIATLDPAPMIRALDARAASTRIAALEMLGGVECGLAAPAVVRLLGDPVVAVRRAACGALGEIGGPTALQPLLEAAAGDDDDTACAAVEALGRVGDPDAYRAVADAFADPRRSAAAARAVQHTRSPALLAELIAHTQVDAETRSAIWTALCAAPAPAKSRLSAVVPDVPDAEIGELLAFVGTLSLAELEQVVAQLEGRGPAVRAAAETFLAENREVHLVREEEQREIALLTAEVGLAEARRHFKARRGAYIWTAAARLGSFGGAAAPLIRGLLESPDPEVRAGAIQAVASAEHLPVDAAVVVGAMRDPAPTVRYYACCAALFHRLDACVEALSAIVHDDTMAEWFKTVIGPRVSDAAGAALDEISPASRAWRRPFQKLFESAPAPDSPA